MIDSAIKFNDFQRGQQLIQPKPKVIPIQMGAGIEQKSFVVKIATDEENDMARNCQDKLNGTLHAFQPIRIKWY